MNLFSDSLMYTFYVHALNIFGRIVHYKLHMSELRYFQFSCAFLESPIDSFCLQAYRSSDGELMEMVSRNYEV